MNAKTLLTGAFVTALMAAQVMSAKLIAVPLPILGVVSVPGGTLAYAITFFATDTIGELYGKAEAKRVVTVGFLMNFVLLALLYITVFAPPARGSLDPEMVRTVLLSGTNIIMGSLGAYILSQYVDVAIFHRLRAATNGDKLYLRNIASTATSQTIDTTAFTGIAFLVAPTILDVGNALPISVIVSLTIGQVIVKALIAVLDTPFVYLAVEIVERH